jgi:hypothetical protein
MSELLGLPSEGLEQLYGVSGKRIGAQQSSHERRWTYDTYNPTREKGSKGGEHRTAPGSPDDLCPVVDDLINADECKINCRGEPTLIFFCHNPKGM